MELIVREVRPDEVEQEVTQRDQFNTDTVGLVETLVRESFQNSMDGRSRASPGPVRTRIRLVDGAASDAAFWRSLFEPLRPHLVACGIDVSTLTLHAPRLLVLEDFGTTGLLGAVDRKDDENFSDFWRRTGRSHKGGEQGGRWGLGKLVFSSSSRIRTFFGLSVQEDHRERGALLMGQAVLKTHSLGNAPPREFAPHAFFAVRGPGGLQIPAADPGLIRAFVGAAGLARADEPGLSVVIPFVHDEITPEAMLPHVVRNWFFPILTGRLVADVGSVTLDRSSFAEAAQLHGGPEFADGSRVAFINELHAARAQSPAITLQAGWSGARELAFPADALLRLRDDYAAGLLVGVRAPLTIRPRTGGARSTFVDLYLRANPQASRGEAFFVRGAITIPGEARRFRGRGCFGALVAEDAVVATFLGDAEGPAHTSWSGTAEKLRENWKNPSERLREIRDALNRLYEVVAQTADTTDPDALRNLFFVQRAGSARANRRRNPVVRNPDIPPLKRRQTPYEVTGRKGGFTIRSTSLTIPPLEIAVRTAYDVVEGNALRQYSKYDFDLTRNEVRIESSGAVVRALSPNELRIEVMSRDFTVTLSGFDHNRDIFVKARVA